MLSDSSSNITFLTECIANTDCPDGGTNYVCTTNECTCPANLPVEDGNACVGMSLFSKENC